MSKWPWPKDTTTDRLKRIIDSYRTALRDVDAATCNLIDARMAEYGQGWITNDEIIDVNEIKPATEIAAQFGLQPWDIQNWSRRHPDRIPKRGMRRGRNLFRVGDVLAFQVWLRDQS